LVTGADTDIRLICLKSDYGLVYAFATITELARIIDPNAPDVDAIMSKVQSVIDFQKAMSPT
jgi:hypothetical protein